LSIQVRQKKGDKMKDTSLEHAVELISEETMKGYEQVRQSGLTNMFNFENVIQAAEALDVGELMYISYEEYKVLLMNFGGLMKHYGITQERCITWA